MTVKGRPLVSIVTISFNQAAFLEQAMRSVLSQTYPHIEYIVVDPGSTDESRDIIHCYRSRLAHAILEPDKGPADGLNKGFRHASGEIFAFLNSDDMLLPHAVERAVHHLQRTGADLVTAHGYIIDAHNRILRRTFSHRLDLTAYVYGACILVQQSTFFRADAYRQVGGFNTANPVSWDGELWFEMLRGGARLVRVHEYWSCFRHHACSITVTGRLAAYEKAVKRRLAASIGIDPRHIDSQILHYYYRVLNRLSDPIGTALRIAEVLRLTFGKAIKDPNLLHIASQGAGR